MGDRARSATVPLLLALVTLLALAPIAWRGWIPQDEGFLAQSASRLLAGEVPHRDFFDCYTGGLTALHAAAFAALGESIGAMRWLLLLAVAATAPVLHAVAARAVGPGWSLLVLAAALAWGPAVYFAPLPSWYVTLLTIHATACLLRHADTGRRGWLVLAGVLGGAAVAIKVVGLYSIAAALLFLLALARAPAAAEARLPGRLDLLAGPVAAAGLGLLLLVLLGRDLGGWTVPVLLAPAAAGATALGLSRPRRAGPLLGPLGAYLAGVALPLGTLLLLFGAAGALLPLLRGVFVLPAQRLTAVTYPLALTPWAAPLAVAWLALLLAPPRGTGRARAAAALAAGLALAAALLGARAEVYQLVWSVMRLVGPACALGGAFVTWRELDGATDEARARLLALFLTSTTAGLLGLVQFPYAFGVYLAYTAPVVLLAAAHLVGRPGGGARATHAALLLGGLLFALLWVDRANVRAAGVAYLPPPPLRRLDLPRAGGLLVPEADAEEYEALGRALDAATRPGEPILALHDVPEVYFLFGRRNPTGTMYEVFDPDFGRPEARAARLGATIDAAGIRAVVINPHGEISGAVDRPCVAALVSRLPIGDRVGRFVVLRRP